MAICWTRPNGISKPESGEVYLWRLSVDEVKGCLVTALEELAQEEKIRADRFRVEMARAEFVFGRCLLRRLIGYAGGLKRDEIAITTGPFGKPSVDGLPGIDFNVSHSNGLILVAMSRAGVVGVDVEYVDSRRSPGELVDMAKEILGTEEVIAVRQIAPLQGALEAFYLAWTRREALAKVTGEGIASPASYRLAPQAGGATYLAEVTDGADGTVRKYLLSSFEVQSGYVGALATCRLAPVTYYDAAPLFVC